ncbi:glycoside hydrolase superfamily [Kalaharituber pfeilii]|nr:glycoside hydrolase superfamily [Kalaharituber pfeilii]
MAWNRPHGSIGPPPPPVPWNSRPNSNYPAQQDVKLPEPLKVFVNAAYYPNWAVYKQGPPSSLNVGCISHAFYAFVHVNEDGTIAKLSDVWADTQIEVDETQGCLKAFGKLKKEHKHLKVIISVGGGGPGGQHFAAVAREEHKRRVFAHSASTLVQEYGLDGIDIDWEHPQNSTEGHHYILLLHELRNYLPPPYLLTSALPAGEWALRNINLSAAANYLDLINLMAYDFCGPWTPQSGHQAQLYTPLNPHSEHATNSGHKAICYLESQHVPLHKVLLGVPVYGRSFLGAHTVGQPPHGQGGEDGVFLYKDLPRPGAEEFIDEAVGAAYSVGGDGGFVTYDNPETVRMKANYVREKGLGGIFFWTGAADVRSGQRSLIETSYVTLHTQL